MTMGVMKPSPTASPELRLGWMQAITCTEIGLDASHNMHLPSERKGEEFS